MGAEKEGGILISTKVHMELWRTILKIEDVNSGNLPPGFLAGRICGRRFCTRRYQFFFDLQTVKLWSFMTMVLQTVPPVFVIVGNG